MSSSDTDYRNHIMYNWYIILTSFPAQDSYICHIDPYKIYFHLGNAGCMAALEAEHYLQEIGAQEGKSDWSSKNMFERSQRTWIEQVTSNKKTILKSTDSGLTV